MSCTACWAEYDCIYYFVHMIHAEHAYAIYMYVMDVRMRACKYIALAVCKCMCMHAIYD